ncbi:hypothetical protein BSKO_05346 [Bryopsis sp. KO-2023]|nr:hypothetical protein BSKO_05346 [Bryopsis sp. KO-2023]
MECKLTEGLRAYLAQGTLVVLVLGALLFKRSIERPRRPMVVWLMDISKQGFSASSCHVSNILFAVIASKGRSDATECSWYFIQYNVDNIIGVTMTILTHQIFIRIARMLSRDQEELPKVEGEWRLVDALSQCGEYGNPPSFVRWGVQVTEWILSVIVGRTISGMSTVLLRSIVWYPLAEGLDNLFVRRPVQHVFFVLVFYPLCCGLTVAWIQDGVLKLRVQPNHGESEGEEEEEPLLASDSEDENGGSQGNGQGSETSIRIVEEDSDRVGEQHDRNDGTDSAGTEQARMDIDLDSAYNSTPMVKKSGVSFSSSSSSSIPLERGASGG